VITSLNFLLPLSAVPARLWPSRVAWFTPGGIIGVVSLCILWFHPLVWSIGVRLALYRELSCVKTLRIADSADISFLRSRNSSRLKMDRSCRPEHHHFSVIASLV